MSETQTPVYKTGESVGAIISSNEAVIAQPAPVQDAPPVVADAPAPPDIVPPVAPASIPDTAPVATPSTSNFSIPDFDAPAAASPAAAQPTPTTVDWKDAIKKADAKEILKELGFNEFAIEVNEHIKNGGDPADYFNAKAIDYNKVSDSDIIKNELQKQYKGFSKEQIDLLFEDKYVAEDGSTEREVQIKELNLQADAYNKRQALIEAQQKFKIPAPVQFANEQEQALQAENRRKQAEADLQWFTEHEANKTLLSSKRVTLNLGDNGNFNFNIEKPELLMKVMTDGPTWQKINLNKQGEPDVVKQQKIALYALNPEQFENDLVNYGKSLALPRLLEEGQNISPQAKVIPVQGANVSEKEKWKTEARSSTIGGGR